MIRRTLFAAAVTALVALAVGAGSATAGSSADSAYARDASSATAAAARAGQRRAVRRRAARRRSARNRRCAVRRCRRPVTRPGAGKPDRAPAPAPSPNQPSPVDPLAGPPLPPAPVLGSYLSVRATEYSYALSRPVVAAGRVTFELRNGGEDPHNLVVSPEGSHQVLASFADLDPGLVAAQGVDLAQGRYYLWCSLDAHEAMGMKATLRVE